MCNALVWSFDAITAVNWIEVIKVLVSIAMACIAFSALENWKRQDSAKRKAELLDALLKAMHTYMSEISKPWSILKFAKTGFDCYSPSKTTDSNESPEIIGAIHYINEQGKSTAKKILDALESVRQSTIELKSIAEKIQIYNLSGYSDCYSSILNLVWQFNKIESFAFIINDPECSWNHPDMQNLLNIAIKTDPDKIKIDIDSNHGKLLGFIRNNYKQIYD